MRSIGRLFSAFGTLADSVHALASVVDVVTGRLRQSLALDEAAPALPGEVLDATESNGIASTKRSKARAGV